MDEKSTPIESLNNRTDDSEVVNNILNKYNSLQDGQTNIPPLNNNISNMENKFENRNLNQEMYERGSDNEQYKEHYQNELKRTTQVNNPKQNNIEQQYDDSDEEEYEEYEMVELPLWRRVLNEIRIPVYIFIFIVIFSNSTFDKLLIKKVPFLGNEYNDCNTYGFLLKAFVISILSYIFIRFIRF
jgi:hypothetical protein